MVKTYKRRSIISLLMVIFCLLSSVIVVRADNGVSVDAMLALDAQSSGLASNICTEANKYATKGNVLSCSNNTLKFSNKNYSKMETEDKEDFMEAALTATTKSGMNTKMKNKVYNFIASQDTPVSNSMKYLQSDASADFLEAKKIFDPFSGVIGTILGVLTTAIFLFAGLSMLIDVMYLVLPGFQAVLERGEENKRPWAVSNDAFTAKRDSEKSDEHKNVLSLYLKRRIGLIVAMAICLGYLISGKIYDVIVYFIDAFSSI